MLAYAARPEIKLAHDEGSKQEPKPDEPKPEVKLKTIAFGKFRDEKCWESGLGPPDTPALMLSLDGAEHGIRRPIGAKVTEGESKDLATNDLPRDASDSSSGIPFRLVFSDPGWYTLLPAITGSELANRGSTVHVRPFKYLLTHEQKLRAALETCRGVDLEATSAAPESSEPGESRDETEASTESDPPSKAGNSGKLADLGGVEITPHVKLLMELLVSFMDEYMTDIFEIRKQIADRTLTEIAFENLAHLYKPGDIVLTGSTSDTKSQRAYQVLFVTGGRPLFQKKFEALQKNKQYSYRGDGKVDVGGFEVDREDFVSNGLRGRATKMSPVILDCFYIDFDGVKFGPRPKRFVITEFRGRKSITALDVFPGEFDPNFDDVRRGLRSRGANFAKFAKGTHKEYDGYTLQDSLAGQDVEKVSLFINLNL